MMVQKAEFSTGGFVLHKIPDGTGKISAWYDPHGELMDYERIDSRGRSTMRISKATREKIVAMGKRHMVKKNPVKPLKRKVGTSRGARMVKKYTFNDRIMAHNMSRTEFIMVPDQVADNQKEFDGKNFPVIKPGNIKGRATLMGDEYDLWGSGTGDMVVRITNPKPRTRRVGTSQGAKSRTTGKTPTKRLRKRRTKNTKPGYYPNPSKKFLAIHLNAGNDASGNPRRLYVIVDIGGAVHAVIDEGYNGQQAIRMAGFPSSTPIIGQFPVPVRDYRNLLKSFPPKRGG